MVPCYVSDLPVPQRDVCEQLKRMLRINYRTAWYLCHRIREAMKANADRPNWRGTIEVDETFIGGRQRGHQHKPGHPECKKEVVIGIRQRGGELRSFMLEDVKSGTLGQVHQGECQRGR